MVSTTQILSHKSFQLASQFDDSSLTLMPEGDCEQSPQIQDIVWSCAQFKGYSYAGQGSRERLPLHEYNEDAYSPNKKGEEIISIHGDRLFFLGDGHAGSEAPVFFITGLSQRLLQLLDSMKFDFSLEHHQHILKEEIMKIYLELDEEYTSIKTLEYQHWVIEGSPADQRPMDDGCTMICNIIQAGWILNLNVGDSRTVLAKPSLYTKEWTACFSSEDHNMTHPGKVASIQGNGGKFLDSTGTTILNVKVVSPEERDGRPYFELGNSRIFRPRSPEIKAVGCSHRRTLNLSGTMGDLLFKIYPPVLTCAPDISFIKLERDSEHILIVASDGMWDHLSTTTHSMQNKAVIQKVCSLLSDFMDESLDGSVVSGGSQETESNLFEDALDSVCKRLVDREANDEQPFYSKNLARYDDITVFLCLLRGRTDETLE